MFCTNLFSASVFTAWTLRISPVRSERERREGGTIRKEEIVGRFGGRRRLRWREGEGESRRKKGKRREEGKDEVERS